MSNYQLQRGDRVRVVVEGTYAQTFKSTGRVLLVDNDGAEDTRIAGEHVVSVEKVSPPLPTTPGSFIRWRDCDRVAVPTYRTLGGDGLWYTPGSDLGTEPEHLTAGQEVIFDAGAAS